MLSQKNIVPLHRQIKNNYKLWQIQNYFHLQKKM